MIPKHQPTTNIESAGAVDVTGMIARDKKPFAGFFSPQIIYEPGKYISQFDGWRGWGIFFVLLAHAYREKFIVAWVFMDMFFVLSGFLITGILLDTLHKKNYIKNFIARRVLRVFPVYYLSLFILFYVLPNSWIDLSYYKEKQIWFWTYMQNWLYSIEYFPPQRALHHFWSLAIEEQFYIVWPFAVLILSRKNLLLFCFFLIVFSILFRNFGDHLGFVPPYYYVATLARMEGLALGAISAILIRQNKHILERLIPYLIIIPGIIICFLFAYARSMDFLHPVNYRYTFTFVDLFFTGLILFTLTANKNNWLVKLLNIKWIHVLGTISYAVYIIHYPIIEIILENFRPFFTELTHNKLIAKVICIVIAYTMTIILAKLSFKFFEMPILKLKKYFN